MTRGHRRAVSGAGTGTEGRQMWQRVKGRTEDDVAAPDLQAYALRPGFIEPEHDARPRAGWIRAVHTLLTPLSALLVRLAPGIATSTSQLGRSMLAVARSRPERRMWPPATLPVCDACDARCVFCTAVYLVLGWTPVDR